MGRLDSTYLSADSAKFEELAALVRDVHIGGFCAFGGVELVPSVMLNATYGPTILGPAARTGRHPEPPAERCRRCRCSWRPTSSTAWACASTAPRGFRGPWRLAPRAIPRSCARPRGSPAVEARALGVHVNFAPVADVNNNPRNPVINIRSFGEDPGAGRRAGARGRGGAAERRRRGHAEALSRARRHRRRHAPGAGHRAARARHGSTAWSWRRFATASPPAPAPRWWRTWRCRRSTRCRGRPRSAGRSCAGCCAANWDSTGVIYTDSMLMEAVNALADPGEARGEGRGGRRGRGARPARRCGRRPRRHQGGHGAAAGSRARGSRPRRGACSRTRRAWVCTARAPSTSTP